MFYKYIIALFVLSCITPSFASAADRNAYENVMWESVLNSDTKEMYQTYINEYPKGHYIRIAKIRYKQLGGKEKQVKTDNDNKNIGIANSKIIAKPAEEKRVIAKRALEKNKDNKETSLIDVEQCNAHMKANRLTSGKGGNALNCFRSILSTDPNNQDAIQGIDKIGKKYLSWAKIYIKKKKYNKALKYYNKAKKLVPELKELNKYKTILDKNLRQKEAD